MNENSINKKLQGNNRSVFLNMFNLYNNEMVYIAMKYTKNRADAEGGVQGTADR